MSGVSTLLDRLLPRAPIVSHTYQLDLKRMAAATVGRLGGSDLPAPRLLRTKAAAIYLGVSPWTVRRLVWSGELPAHRGRRMRFDVKDLDAWIEKQKRRVI